MDFIKKLFKPRGDEYEAALRSAEARLATFERQLRKDVKTWQDVQLKRPRELEKVRQECYRRLLMCYSWALNDMLEMLYRSCVLLMKRALLRSLVDEAALAALADQLYATQAWRKHLLLLADEQARAAAAGQPLPLPTSSATTKSRSGSSSSSGGMDDLLPLDVTAFCTPPEEVVRTAPNFKRLQKRVARITAALAESDAAIRSALPSLGAPTREARRDALAVLIAQEAEADIHGAAAEGDFMDDVEALKAAIVKAQAQLAKPEAETDSAAPIPAFELEARRYVASLAIHPAAPWVFAYLLHRGPEAVVHHQADRHGGIAHRASHAGAEGIDATGVQDVTAMLPVGGHGTGHTAVTGAGLPPLHGPGRPGGAAGAQGGIASPLRPVPAAARGRDAFDRGVVSGSGSAVVSPPPIPPSTAGHGHRADSKGGSGEVPKMAYMALDAWARGDTGIVQQAHHHRGSSGELSNPFNAQPPSGAAGQDAQQAGSAASAQAGQAGQMDVNDILWQRAAVRPALEWELAHLLFRGCPSGSTLTPAQPDTTLAALLVHKATRDKLASLASIMTAAWARRQERKLRESAFARLVADQRHSEGRLLQRWCDRVLAAGFDGVYAYEMPRFMGYDPGRGWLDKERAALGIGSPGGSGDGGVLSPIPAVSSPALVLADAIDGTGPSGPSAGAGAGAGTGTGVADATVPGVKAAAAPRPEPSPVSSAGGTAATDYSGIPSPTLSGNERGGAGSSAAGGGGGTSKGTASVRGGVPPPKLVNAFLAHFTKDLAEHVGLNLAAITVAAGSSVSPTSGSTTTTSSSSSSSSAANTGGYTAGLPIAALVTSQEDINRLLRARVNALVYPRLHALLFTGVDIVFPSTPGSYSTAGVGDGAGAGTGAVGGMVGSADMAVASAQFGLVAPSGLSRSTSGVDMTLAMPSGPRVSEMVAQLDAEAAEGRQGGRGGAAGQGQSREVDVTGPQRPPGSAADAALRRDRIWLRKQPYAAALSGEEIGVPAQYFTSLAGDREQGPAQAGQDSHFPFAMPSALLAHLDSIKQPMEAAAVLTAAVDAVVAEATSRAQAAQRLKAAQEQAAAQGEAGEQKPLKPVHVTAEDLIPLLIYVCSRSAWKRPHACLAFASSFSVPPGSAGGKEAYLVALIQSCIAWVCQRKAPAPAPAAAPSTPARQQGQQRSGAIGLDKRRIGSSSSSEGAGGASGTGGMGGMGRPVAATYDGPTLAFDAFAASSAGSEQGNTPDASREPGLTGLTGLTGRSTSFTVPRSTGGSIGGVEDMAAGGGGGAAGRRAPAGAGAEVQGDEEAEYDAEKFDAAAAVRAAAAAAALADETAGGTIGDQGHTEAGQGEEEGEGEHSGLGAPGEDAQEAAEYDREYEELLEANNGDPLSMPGLAESELASALQGSAKEGAAGHKGSRQTATGGLRALIAEQDAIEGALSIFG